MISLEKMNDIGTFTKIAWECRRFGKLIVAKGFKKLPKVQKITNSGHTGRRGQRKCWSHKGFRSPVRVKQVYSGQSYKHFTLVNYDSRVLPSYKASTIVIYDSRVVPDWKIPHITTLES